MRESNSLREFTPLALVLGIIIGALFGAANAFVGLQVGMTISASIPAAVISMGVLRGILKRGTLLENNMVQTIGSAGESLAAGMIFTIPALFLFGLDPKYLEMVIWGGIGGLMGVLFMVPLRRVLIVKEHGKLLYPEGVACAEVLESGQRGGAGAKTVFLGLGVGALYEVFRGLGVWADKAKVAVTQIRTEASLSASPALLGVGYILGPRVAGYMLGGAVLGWFVIIPAIGLFGADAAQPIAPAKTLVSDMSPRDMWEQYLRYVGAGAVVLGGLVALLKSAPTIASSVGGALAAIVGRKRGTERTQRDLPFPLLILGLVGLALLMWYVPQIGVSHVGAIAVLVFGFFFVTVSSRLVGIVGSSSNPVSGMTIAALLGTSLIFAYVVHEPGDARFSAISVGALVCIALCIAGDCSQDLKTGFLVKATPWKQQVGEVIGVLTAVVVLAGVILLLQTSYGFDQEKDPSALLAPQANIMKLLVEGVMDRSLPWTLIITGMGAALVVELLGLPALPFAVGLYLPLELSTPIMAGGILRWLVGKVRKPAAEGQDRGILGASGLVAGHGLAGIALAGVTYVIATVKNNPRFLNPITGEEGSLTTQHLMPWLMDEQKIPLRYGLDALWYDLLPLVPFAVLVIWLFITAMRRIPVPIGAAPPGLVPPGPPSPPPEPPGPPLGEGDTGSIPLAGETTPPVEGESPEGEPPIVEFEDDRPGPAAEDIDESVGQSEDDEQDRPPPDDQERDKGGPNGWPPPSPYHG